MENYITFFKKFFQRTTLIIFIFLLGSLSLLAQAPVAVPDEGTIDEDNGGIIATLSDNDEDTDGGTVIPSSIILIDPSNSLNTGNSSTPLVLSTGTFSIDALGTLSYVPTLNFNGTAIIYYTIADNDMNVSLPATVTITVNPVNDAPVAGDDTGNSTDEDTQLSVGNISSNATDVDGTVNASSIVLIDPSNGSNTGQTGAPLVILGVGTYTVDASGNLTYDPALNYNGNADINYTIEDNDGEVSNEATVYIIVSSVNDAPVAGDYTGNSTDEDTQLSVGNISSNATDVDGTVDASSIVLIDPSNGSNTGQTGAPLVILGVGTYTVDASGSLTYDPELNYNGDADIKYTIEDNDGEVSNEATVYITVNPVNDPPASQDDSYTVAEGGTRTVNAPGVLLNDLDIENDPIDSIMLVQDVEYGDITLNNNGSFVYIHDSSETQVDSFVYRVSDNAGVTFGNQAVARITITPVNDAPISQDDSYNVFEGGTLTRTDISGVLANDSDVEDSTITVISLELDVAHGTLAWNADGSFEYVHDGSESLIDSFMYRVSDGEDLGNIATATINILPVNDPPYFQDFSQINRYEGSYTTYTILSNHALDDDTPLENLTFTIGAPTSSNLYTYIIEDTLFIAPVDENWFGIDEIYIRINDNDPSGAEETRDTILVNVTNVDDYPHFTVDTIHVTASDEDLAVEDFILNLNTYVVELDDDSLMLEAPDNDPIFSFTTSFLDPRYLIEATIIPDDWNGERYLNFYIVDDTPQGLKDTIVFHYTINPVDDPPFVENPIANLEVDEDADDVVYDLHNVFEDIDNPDEEMEFSLYIEENEFMQAYISDDELVLTFLEDSNSNFGTNSRPDIVITCLSNSISEIEYFNVYVRPINDPPTFSISGDVIIMGNTEKQEREVTVYPDPVPGDETGIVNYSLNPSTVDFAEVSINPLKGNVKISVEAGATGSEDFTITAFDGEMTAEQNFKLRINEKVKPDITFNEIPNKTLSDSIVILEATTTSDTTVSFSIVSGEASVSNDTLFILGAGVIRVKASCPETDFYKYAEENREFYVEQLIQEIIFNELPDRIYGDEDFVIHASSSSGLGVFFEVEYGPLLVVDDSTMQINGVGEVKVVAHQDGNSIYAAADTVARIFQVLKADQTIDFDALENQIYSPAPISLSASATSELPVSFEVVPGTTGSAYIQGNGLYITGAGYITVRASQSGDILYNAASDVEQTIEIYKANQTISFEPITDTTYGTFTISLNATTSSDLSAEFDWEGPVDISDTLLSITGTGIAYVSAFQPGDERYLPTDTITRSFEIKKAVQYIDLDEPDPIIYGINGIAVSAEASSGLGLRFEILSGPATAEDSIILPYDYGEVVFRIIQEGDENYKSASLDYKVTFVEAVADISLIELLTPASLNQVITDRPITIIVRVKNIGNRDINSFNISYSDDKGDGLDIISEYYPYSLFVGDSVDYSFSSDWTPREESTELCVYLQSTDDSNPTNDTICLSLSTSVNPLSYNKDLINNVYPNPANNFVYLSFGNNVRNGRLIIYNTSGAVIEQFEIDTDANKLIFEVDVNNYRQGTYYYKFINSKEFVSGKFVVY